MKRLLPIILLFLIISESCTVTKRVHRKGWHVEWRKVKQTATEDLAITPNAPAEKPSQKEFRFEESPSENLPSWTEEASNSEAEEIPHTHPVDDYEMPQVSAEDMLESSTPLSQEAEKELESSEQNESDHSKKHTRPSSRDIANAVALIALILAVILAGLGMLLLLWIQAVSSTALIIFLGIFMFGFWILGAFAFVGGVIALIGG